MALMFEIHKTAGEVCISKETRDWSLIDAFGDCLG